MNLKFWKQKSLYNSIGSVYNNLTNVDFNPRRQVTGIAYKAIDKIGESMTVSAPLALKKNGDAYVNHPVLTLYQQPNPRTNSSDFIHLWAMMQIIYGETFWYLAKGENSNRVKEVYLLNPESMQLEISEGEVVGYWMRKANGDRIPLGVDEIIHDKRANPFNEYRGMSVLEKAAVYVDTEINTATFTLNYIKNNASPSGILNLPEMTKEAFEKFKRQWKEKYEGVNNAGKTAIINGGKADFKAVGATLKDVDQKVTRQMAKEDVLMMLGVPKPLLGMTDENGFGRANVEALELIFAKHTLQPLMKRLDRIYTQLAKTMVGEIQITHESPVPQDKEYRHTVNKDLVNVAITVNEVRESLGLKPLPDGDVLATARPEAAKSIKIVKKKTISKSEQVRKIAEEQEQFRVSLVKTNDIYAKKIKSAISKFASAQEQRIKDKIGVNKKAYEDWLFNVKEESEELALLLLPLIVELMETQSEDVAHFITGQVLELTPEIKRESQARILQIAGLYNQETITRLEKTLSDGVTNNESLVQLKKRVEAEFEAAKGYRAERIAKTESLKASNRTAELVYKYNGFSEVEWFINPDACEFCRVYAGRTRSFGGVFTKVGSVVEGDDGGMLRVDYDDIDVPPLHPNCECSLIPR